MRFSLRNKKVKINTIAGVQEGIVTNDYEEDGIRKIRVLTRKGSFVKEEREILR